MIISAIYIYIAGVETTKSYILDVWYKRRKGMKDSQHDNHVVKNAFKTPQHPFVHLKK